MLRKLPFRAAASGPLQGSPPHARAIALGRIPLNSNPDFVPNAMAASAVPWNISTACLPNEVETSVPKQRLGKRRVEVPGPDPKKSGSLQLDETPRRSAATVSGCALGTILPLGSRVAPCRYFWRVTRPALRVGLWLRPQTCVPRRQWWQSATSPYTDTARPSAAWHPPPPRY